METNKNIPDNINALGMLEAAQFYRDKLGWTLHPLYGPDNGSEQERGKRPLLKGWKRLGTADVTAAFLEKHFGNGHRYNLGKVNHLPELTIDLDSKPDKGASVMAWDEACEDFRAVPCERTAGGLHYHLLCEDVPDAVIDAVGKEQKLKGMLTDKVGFEIFLGGNIVLAPSRHKTGHQYTWLRTGAIPVVPWALIQKLFPFKLKADAEEPRPKKRKAASWWVRFNGDLSSLDIVALAKELGVYGALLDADENKHSIRCPWHELHTQDKGHDKVDDSGTVIFFPRNRRFPGFKCLHTSHGEKKLEDFLAWAETQSHGIVDRHCAQSRVWSEGQRSADGRPRVLLPSPGRSDSEFAADAGGIMNGVHHADGLFLRHGVPVEVSTVHLRDKQAFLGFAPIKPARAITLIEKFADIGQLVQDEAKNLQFMSVSMDKSQAEILLSSPQFRRCLPRVDRILDVPVPILKPNGALVYPRPGYDPECCTYLNPDAPKITPMDLSDARELLRTLFSEFCFHDAQSLIHALAAFITPFCKGLFPRWNARTPVWLYKANRERAGKDYCANLTSILYEGRTSEDPPLDSDVAETRKKVTAALMSGRRRIHWSNCRGHIANATFEGLVTAEMWTDRILGVNDEVTIPNELELSLSANTGLTYTPDFANRCRPILFHYEEEDANARRFRNPDLHGWLHQHRGLFVSTLAALVNSWDQAGRPPGPTPFTSFPIWAKVVGGILVHARLGDPCMPVQDETCDIDGDQQTANMKTLFALAHEKFGTEWVRKDRIMDLLKEEGDGLFSWMDLTARSGQVTFSKLITKFAGRILGGIRMLRNATAKQTRFHTFQFIPQEDETPGDKRQDILDQLFTPDERNIRNIRNIPPTPRTENDESKSKIGNGIEISKSDIELKNIAYIAHIALPGHTLVCAPADLPAIADQLAASAQPIVLDIETYGQRGGLNPWDGDIRLLSLAIPGAVPWILDLRSIGYDLGPLADVLAANQVLGHNIKFDALWLRVKCGLILANLADTMTASRLLTAGSGLPNGLDAVIQRFCNIDLPKDQAQSDWGGMLLTEDQLQYAANDVRYLHQANAALMTELEQADLASVYALEMSLLPHVVAMEANGVTMDRGRLNQVLAEAETSVIAAKEQIQTIFNNPDLNPASAPQLKAALNEAGLLADGTSEEALLLLDDTRFIPHILTFRKAQKVMEQARKLATMIARDGRIHARFEPTGTDTGRFSSKEPNLQNIGRGALRSCFVAPAGHCLVVADYSQIELRAAAAIANEPRMIEAYQRGDDLHRQTAALVLNKPLAEVTKDDRQLAKAVNFGLLYGQSPGGLIKYARTNYGVTLSQEQARRIHQRFFDAYSGLRVWHRNCHATATTATEVRTVSGRRRLLPQGPGKEWHRFAAMLNTPVQGGCADGLKCALVTLARSLPAKARLVSTVHDEIIVETPVAVAGQVAELVRSTMCSAMARLFPNVPIEVEVKQCGTWGDK